MLISSALVVGAFVAAIGWATRHHYHAGINQDRIERGAVAAFGPHHPVVKAASLLDPIQDVTGDMPPPSAFKAELIRLHERKRGFNIGVSQVASIPERPARWRAPRLTQPIRSQWA